MATTTTTGVGSTCSDSNLSGRTWLRVKRKRTDDSVDALVLGQLSKKARVASDGTPSVGNITFRFVGTLADDSAIPEDVLTRVQPRAEAASASASSEAATASSSPPVDHVKPSGSKSHFRAITKQRSRRTVEDVRRRSRRHARLKRVPVGVSVPRAPSPDEPSAEDDEVRQILQVYDVVREDGSASPEDCSTGTSSPRSRNGDIMCNATRMLRENLSIRDGVTPGMASSGESYVYDLYFAEDSLSDISDRVSIEPFTPELVVDIGSDDYEHYEDEDDSNDEDNWRNDYPDEDYQGDYYDCPDGAHVPGIRGSGVVMSSDDEDYHPSQHGAYRSRAIKKILARRKDNGAGLGDDEDDDDDDDDDDVGIGAYDWYNRNLGKLGMAVPAASTAPPLNGSGGFGYEEEYSQVAYDPDVED